LEIVFLVTFTRNFLKENFDINFYELININVSAYGHLITLVWASGGPRPTRRDWLIDLIGIASKKVSLSKSQGQ